MREHPWHLRNIGTITHFRFSHLAEIHRLTLDWLKELEQNRPAYELTRSFSTRSGLSLADNHRKVLEGLVTEDYDSLIGSHTPETVLHTTERIIYVTQAWTLAWILEHTPASDLGSVMAILEQQSWNSGKKYAEANWSQGLGCTSLESALVALESSAFSDWKTNRGFFIRRATSAEISLLLLGCPHQSHHTEVRAQADALCNLYSHWTRGFLFALNNRIRFATSRTLSLSLSPPPSQHCVQNWTLS